MRERGREVAQVEEPVVRQCPAALQLQHRQRRQVPDVAAGSQAGSRPTGIRRQEGHTLALARLSACLPVVFFCCSPHCLVAHALAVGEVQLRQAAAERQHHGRAVPATKHDPPPDHHHKVTMTTSSAGFLGLLLVSPESQASPEAGGSELPEALELQHAVVRQLHTPHTAASQTVSRHPRRDTACCRRRAGAVC